ncbi:MAG: NAD(P)/FAD-dependent oxidoreductase [Phycisphaerales bacterium]
MVQEKPWEVSVCIAGGGPAGATCGALLRKYNPDVSVLIVEKATFPRDHVGESQLPGCAHVCHEMGCWDEIEAAGFPIKIGASYTWGANKEIWDFDFVDPNAFPDMPRPGKFEGVRRQTAFQVDRAKYDEILLNQAAKLGCEVVQGVQVTEVERDGDRIVSLGLSDGRRVNARHYVDATGAPAVLRRAMGVESFAPKELRNIAVWGYWENAEWAVNIGVGGTRVQVRSLPYGWIWFIPLGPTRTSIGLIVPTEHYKASGKRPEELYHEAIRQETSIAPLIKNARMQGETHSIKDWSHLADRLVGENWWLIGESAGFADPILAAGMLVAHNSGRDLAYTLNEMERGELDSGWLRTRFNERHRRNIWQYIRFAQFWYAANGCFTDLQEQCAKIAGEGGLKLDPKQAWRWLSQGGFAIDEVIRPSLGSYDVFAARDILGAFLGGDRTPVFQKYNVFTLNLHGAEPDVIGDLKEGRIIPTRCLRKGKSTLPLAGYYGNMVRILQQTQDITTVEGMIRSLVPNVSRAQQDAVLQTHMAVLEVMVQEGWVLTKTDKKRPFLRMRAAQAEGSRAIIGGRS